MFPSRINYLVQTLLAYTRSKNRTTITECLGVIKGASRVPPSENYLVSLKVIDVLLSRIQLWTPS
jgi:hypothetical protein